MERKLYTSPDKKLCGVCAGLADYFNMDPTIMRIIVAEVALFTAIIPALLIYFIVALVVPKAPEDYYQIYNNTSRRVFKGHDKKICGVCSGVAEYFNMDPTIVRLLFVLLTLLVGNGVFTYIILACILPTAPDSFNADQYTNQYYEDPNQQNENYNPEQ